MADSLIRFLSKLSNDTPIEIVGLTHKDIYTLREHYTTLNKKDTVLFSYKGIFGLGYIPGNSCMISDYRFRSTDKNLWNNRLKKVVIHEIGHNLGISHCKEDTCLVSESNGDVKILNKAGAIIAVTADKCCIDFIFQIQDFIVYQAFKIKIKVWREYELVICEIGMVIVNKALYSRVQYEKEVLIGSFGYDCRISASTTQHEQL